MRLTSRLALALLLALPAAAGAQSSAPANVGDNANIIPIYKSTPPGEPPAADDYLRGNLLGQRCNEPSIGISSINRDHMMVFCNDYRATYDWDDSLVPSGKTTLVASVWKGMKTLFARVTGRKEPRGESEENEKIIASAEAGIGGGVSYDGGLTWQGFMVPGGPNDGTPASLAHPGKALNLQGYSDPWAVSLPQGRVGVTYIGFTRDKVTGQSTQSGVFFTRYRDRNASDVLHDWEYEFSSQVALSNNLTQGQFLDKVSATVGPATAARPLGTLYVAYTRFTGSSGSSNIFLAQSSTAASSGRRPRSTRTRSTAREPSPSYTPRTPPPRPVSSGARSSAAPWSTRAPPRAPRTWTCSYRSGRSLQAVRPVPPADQRRTRTGSPSERWPSRPRLTRPTGTAARGRLHGVDRPRTLGAPARRNSRPMPMVVMKVSADKRRDVVEPLRRELGEPREGRRAAVSRGAGLLQHPEPGRHEEGGRRAADAVGGVHRRRPVHGRLEAELTSAMAQGGSENSGSPVTAGFTRRFDVRAALLSFSTTAPWAR